MGVRTSIHLEPMMAATAPRTMHSPLAYGVLMVLAAAGFLTPNPWESVWTLTLLAFILRWFWWKEYPGILLFCLLAPFIEIHTTVLEANTAGLTLDELYTGPGRQTFWMASAGLFAVLLGFRTALGRIWHDLHPPMAGLQEAARSISQTKLLIATIAINTGGVMLNQAIPWGSPLQQLETYYASISSATTLCFALHFWLTRQRPWLVLVVFGYLLVTSFYSYFSAWRGPLTILLVSILVTYKDFKLRQVLTLTPILIPAFVFVFVWQSVKGEYRMFLSSGERQQVIRVSQAEALAEIWELAQTAYDQNQIWNDQVVNATYRRAGYLEYFSAAVSKVPTEIPHEKGALLQESLTFAFVPRLLNPNKGVKNDRIKVERYTDYYFGASSFSSFSLGHYCEAYIDWGPFGMMLHLLCYGIVGGLLVRTTLKRTRHINPLLGLGLLWAVMYPWGTFQQDMVTVAGRTGWGAFCQLLLFFPIYMWTHRFVQQEESVPNAIQ